jgi:hypothetical protein
MIGNITPDPLHVGAELPQHIVRFCRRLPQLFPLESADLGNVTLDDELPQNQGFRRLGPSPLPNYGFKAPGSAACDLRSTLRNSAQQRHKNARRRVFAEAACSVSRAYEASDAGIFPRVIDR